MQVSKTTNVTLPASASWRIEKFSLLELFKTIENEYTALIPASENYRTTVVVCRDISDETRYTLEEFKKYFSDSAPFKSITLCVPTHSKSPRTFILIPKAFCIRLHISATFQFLPQVSQKQKQKIF